MHAGMIGGIGVALALSIVSQPHASGAGASVATIVVPTGLDEDDVKRLQNRVNAQVSAMGGKPRSLSRALEVKDECLDDPACARAVLRAADAPWLLWVDALRAGPKVQIDARLIDVDGRVVAEGGGVVSVDEVFKGRAAVPPDVLAPLRHLDVGDKGVDGDEDLADVRKPPTALQNPPAPLAIAGVVVATGGLVVTVISLALIPGQLAVIDDPTSLGEEKAIAARVMFPALVTFSVAGVLVAGGGGAMVLFAE